MKLIIFLVLFVGCQNANYAWSDVGVGTEPGSVGDGESHEHQVRVVGSSHRAYSFELRKVFHDWAKTPRFIMWCHITDNDVLIITDDEIVSSRKITGADNVSFSHLQRLVRRLYVQRPLSRPDFDNGEYGDFSTYYVYPNKRKDDQFQLIGVISEGHDDLKLPGQVTKYVMELMDRLCQFSQE